MANDLVGAGVSCHGGLLLGGNRGDHPGSECLADLDGGDADTSGRSQHEQRFVGPETGPVDQGVIRGSVGHRDCCPNLESDVIGESDDGAREGSGALCHRSRPHEPDHPVTWFEAIQAVGRLEDAGEFVARDERKLRLDLILTGNHQEILKVHSRRLDCHHGGPGKGSRIGHLADAECVQTVVTVADEGAHG